MTHDIKATVEFLERQIREHDGGPNVFVAHGALPSLLAELRRLWAKEARQDAIEEAAVSLREASESWVDATGHSSYLGYLVTQMAALFAALPPRKPSGGEESKP